MSGNSDLDQTSLLPRWTRRRPTAAAYGAVDDVDVDDHGPRPAAPPALSLSPIGTTSERPSPSQAININTSPALLRQTSVRALAVAESIKADRENRGESQPGEGKLPSMMPQLPLAKCDSMDSIMADLECQRRLSTEGQQGLSCSSGNLTGKKTRMSLSLGSLGYALGQVPAILIAAVLNFMVGIPFGASYFPTELPLPGKEVLGLRMFLFSTILAQMVFTYKSKFDNGIGLQMVENVPFYIELARIVMDEQGTGSEALSTLFFILGLSSILVGLTFYLLGKLELGRIVYFFPSHVLVGCIGGIGAFICITAIEVSTNSTFSFSQKGFEECIVANFHLLAPVIAFELVLRVLIHVTEGRYTLLNPIYYCMTTPVFYFALWLLGVSTEKAGQLGYFFPALDTGGNGMLSTDLFDIFTFVNLGDVSFRAVAKALPTLVSLAVFSLIHVPINIPAFAITTNTEPDMNNELIAHGWSNGLSGLAFGLQNYMTYSNSVVYAKSSGKGRVSSIAVAALTVLIFIWGPIIAAYVPRCIAGTLLFHLGVDLFKEGVVDSYHDYDRLEYGGCWLITISMVALGMDAGLVAGAIAALATFAAQSIINQHPVKGSMTASTLRSSAWNRSLKAEAILSCEKGRRRILICQLEGHIFFGNSTSTMDDIKERLTEKRNAGQEPFVLILDFSQVVGIDSTAAHAIAKLKESLLRNFLLLEVILFVTRDDEGFPCDFALSTRVCPAKASIRIVERKPGSRLLDGSDSTSRRMSITARAFQMNHTEPAETIAEIPNSRVFSKLDDALLFGEDVLLALVDPHLFREDSSEHFPPVRASSHSLNEAKGFLRELCPQSTPDEINLLFGLFEREEYNRGDLVWRQGDASLSMKLIASGSLISFIEDGSEAGAAETIHPGSTIGELGLVNGLHRLTTVKVVEDHTQLYSLSLERFHHLVLTNSYVARFIDLLTIKYLAHRVQYVSNGERLDKRSLPV